MLNVSVKDAPSVQFKILILMNLMYLLIVCPVNSYTLPLFAIWASAWFLGNTPRNILFIGWGLAQLTFFLLVLIHAHEDAGISFR